MHPQPRRSLPWPSRRQELHGMHMACTSHQGAHAHHTLECTCRQVLARPTGCSGVARCLVQCCHVGVTCMRHAWVCMKDAASCVRFHCPCQTTVLGMSTCLTVCLSVCLLVCRSVHCDVQIFAARHVPCICLRAGTCLHRGVCSTRHVYSAVAFASATRSIERAPLTPRLFCTLPFTFDAGSVVVS